VKEKGNELLEQMNYVGELNCHSLIIILLIQQGMQDLLITDKINHFPKILEKILDLQHEIFLVVL